MVSMRHAGEGKGTDNNIEDARGKRERKRIPLHNSYWQIVSLQTFPGKPAHTGSKVQAGAKGGPPRHLCMQSAGAESDLQNTPVRRSILKCAPYQPPPGSKGEPIQGIVDTRQRAVENVVEKGEPVILSAAARPLNHYYGSP
jgi:hypothetical protein